jgi:H+/gluconate symporter-like permease
MGLAGIILSLLLLMYLAYRGVSVLVLAPLLALLAVGFSGDAPLFATYTQIFMPALGGYLIQYFPVFLLGAIFGKLMDDSGSASVIAHWIVEHTGRQRAILAIVLACGYSPTAVSRCSLSRLRCSRSPLRCSAKRTCRSV